MNWFKINLLLIISNIQVSITFLDLFLNLDLRILNLTKLTHLVGFQICVLGTMYEDYKSSDRASRLQISKSLRFRCSGPDCYRGCNPEP
jgi:hypothetical protein